VISTGSVSGVYDGGGSVHRGDGGVQWVVRSMSVRGGGVGVCLLDREDGDVGRRFVVVGCKVGCVEVAESMAVGTAVEWGDIVVVEAVVRLDGLPLMDGDILDTPPCNRETAVAVAALFGRHSAVSAARQGESDTEEEGSSAVVPLG